MPASEPGQTFYADYLDLDTLLAAQHPLSDHPDELHFIIVHQVHELWFKLATHQMRQARIAIQDDLILEAVRRLGQIAATFRSLCAAVEHLHTLPPASFHVFRMMLAPGSGMQSFQFREIEVMAGRRDERYLKWVRNTVSEEDHWLRIKARLDEPSLMDAFEALLAARSVPDAAAVYERMDALPDLHALADALSALDHAIVTWRSSHIQLIERTIGAGTTGTGGMQHDYLQQMVQVRLFPALWEARNELSRRVEEHHVQGSTD